MLHTMPHSHRPILSWSWSSSHSHWPRVSCVVSRRRSAATSAIVVDHISISDGFIKICESLVVLNLLVKVKKKYQLPPPPRLSYTQTNHPTYLFSSSIV